MFCPQCKREYAEGIEICPTCGASLVKTLDEENKQYMEPEYVELVTVMETRDRALIALIKSIFEDAGIKYFVNGESLLGLGRAAVDVKIQVGKSDAPSAAELLKDIL